MSWWHSDRKLLTDLTVKVDSLLRANVAILQQVITMSQVHDTLLNLVRSLLQEVQSLHQKVTDLSAKEIEGEQGFQDVTSALENARQEIADAAQQADAALKDNATQGGSTGGGSGAQGNV
jgi:translation initiation factor 2B subunit (eIF-2B alpha/beta/delta family)